MKSSLTKTQSLLKTIHNGIETYWPSWEMILTENTDQLQTLVWQSSHSKRPRLVLHKYDNACVPQAVLASKCHLRCLRWVIWSLLWKMALFAGDYQRQPYNFRSASYVKFIIKMETFSTALDIRNSEGSNSCYTALLHRVWWSYVNMSWHISLDFRSLCLISLIKSKNQR